MYTYRIGTNNKNEKKYATPKIPCLAKEGGCLKTFNLKFTFSQCDSIKL